jgi:hypothetical protein
MLRAEVQGNSESCYSLGRVHAIPPIIMEYGCTRCACISYPTGVQFQDLKLGFLAATISFQIAFSPFLDFRTFPCARFHSRCHHDAIFTQVRYVSEYPCCKATEATSLSRCPPLAWLRALPNHAPTRTSLYRPLCFQPSGPCFHVLCLFCQCHGRRLVRSSVCRILLLSRCMTRTHRLLCEV